MLSLGLFSSLITNNLYAQFPNTLTQEQKDEVEKNPIDIISGCNSRVNSRLDAGNLCDSFSTYLDDKCKRLENIPEYCGELAVYLPKRIIQKDCISNLPVSSDEQGLKKCVDYISLNSTIPLNFSSSYIFHADTGYSKSLDTIFSVYNPNPYVVKIISISFNITKNGKHVESGELNQEKTFISDCPNCFDIKPKTTQELTTSIPDPNPIITSSDPPYIVNAIYKYENPDSTVVTKSFNFTSQ